MHQHEDGTFALNQTGGVRLTGGCAWLQMAAAMGGLTWLFFDMAAQQQSLLGLSCGVLAGLVAVTPAMAYTSIVGSMVMGLVASSAAWCAPDARTITAPSLCGVSRASVEVDGGPCVMRSPAVHVVCCGGSVI